MYLQLSHSSWHIKTNSLFYSHLTAAAAIEHDKSVRGQTRPVPADTVSRQLQVLDLQVQRWGRVDSEEVTNIINLMQKAGVCTTLHHWILLTLPNSFDRHGSRPCPNWSFTYFRAQTGIETWNELDYHVNVFISSIFPLPSSKEHHDQNTAFSRSQHKHWYTLL